MKDARRLRNKAEAERDFRGAIGEVKVLGDVVERLADIGERLAESGGPEEPKTLAEFMARIARGEKARGAESPLRVEYVNDWRAPVGVLPGEPDAKP